MAVGVTIDGYTLPQIQQIIQSINANTSTGVSTGGYSGEAQAVGTTEKTIATAKVGPIAEIYDPEFAAWLSGEL